MAHAFDGNDPLVRTLRDPLVWEQAGDGRPFTPGAKAEAAIAKIEAEEAAAAALCDRLLAGPSPAWAERVRTTPEARTAGVVRELLRRMPALVERRPGDALQATTLAVGIAEVLDEQAYWPEHVVTTRAQALRDHAYVLSFLLRYAEALRYVERAEREFSQVLANELDLGRLALVKASALRMQNRSGEAIALARDAARLFRSIGQWKRYVNARITEAAMLYDGGAVEQALQVWRSVQDHPDLDEVSAVRVAHNIAACLCDLGRQAEAVAPFERCVAELARLGLPTERTRSRWYLGNALLGTARHREAVAVLRAAWRELRELDMPVDAALAALDLAEALVANGRPAAVPAICREVIAQLTGAGLAAQAMPALTLLREAAGAGSASRQLIRQTHATVKRAGLQRTPC